jgi:hypothetical protein
MTQIEPRKKECDGEIANSLESFDTFLDNQRKILPQLLKDAASVEKRN